MFIVVGGGQRALIFDFDGTLIDSEATFVQVWLELLAEHGVSVQAGDLAAYVGVSGSDVQARWEAQLREWLGSGIDAAALDAQGDRRIDAARRSLPLLPGARELLVSARALGCRIGLATGSQREYVERHLDRLAVLDRFDVIVTTHEIERPKPAPDVYLEAARRLEVAPSRCVAVEDSPPGCAAALAAGMTVVVCPCGVTEAFDFASGALRVASLAEVDLGALWS